jgi:putative DNA primase/helicase
MAIRNAFAIWRSTQRAAGSIVERYLRTRGILFDSWPASLRFHPHCPRPKDDAPLPAMVALVEHIERGPVAIHRTFLRPNGTAKADLPKDKQRAGFGPVKGAAVRFGTPRSGEWLVVGEGIESTLSAALPCGLSAWAALSAGGLRELILPRDATHILACADHDTNGIGERAARDAAARWLAEGRRVRVAMPPELGADFNDVLTGLAADKIDEARNVA